MTKVTRNINRKVAEELWGRAAGRCQFNGCNRILYQSTVTQESVNISQKAHIHSISEIGPRGWGIFKKDPQSLNELRNLMLMCHDCHKTIDQYKDGGSYPAELLLKWKKEHEERVLTVTGISSDRKSHVIFYSSKIAEQPSLIQQNTAIEAMFLGNRYPVSQNPVHLSMLCSHEDNMAEFWTSESNHLNRVFESKIRSLIEHDSTKHFSLFSLAPMPLLIQLGTLFTDKIDMDTYQPIREPKTWCWQEYPEGFEFIIEEPKQTDGAPVLIISLSDVIDQERIKTVMKEKVSVWVLTVPKEHIGNDNIRHRKQLSMMREIIRKLMRRIKGVHGPTTPLTVFPAMAVSCSIEMGRARMPKADMPWVIYDQNYKEKKFIQAITIGGN